ncbi:MAG: hypothetical protein IJA31_01675 [Clostridia bacterium]|nr:hypothetical protein [Clostridia bacterium]
MDKDKLLLDVALNLRKLSDSLMAYVDAVIATPPCDENIKEEPTESVKVETDEDLKKKKEKLVLEARAILGTKVTAEAQELIRSYGVQNLSKVDIASFEDLISKAKELTDAPK